MDFELTTEQAMFKDMAKEFGTREVQPYVKQWDRDGKMPHEVFEKLGAQGLLGIKAPAEYGGLDLDWMTLGLVTEQLAYFDFSLGTGSMSRTSLGILPLLGGTEEQKKKYLPGMVQGKLTHCFGTVEPDAGSDATAIKTTAVLEGDEWIINGNKTWITNANICNFAMVVCQTDKNKGTKGLAVIIVDWGTPGFTRAPIEHKMAFRHHDHGQLFFRDCRVPRSNQLGGFGMKAAFSNVEHTRFGIACAAVGAIQACLDCSIKYCQERVQFKKPIGSFQLVQEKIANMVIDLEASRWLAYRLAYMKDKNLNVVKESSIAKYHNMEAVRRSAMAAVELHGAYGLSDEYPVERIYRDCMAPIIYGGTAHVHKMVLGRIMLGIDAVAR
ncbi:MAG TPA: acyl-CoA dehydrogenase family protein [Syntrophales bacterium]|nr:acyl-CoA dehydrogenase family protein [Syntrophales bacterium]HOX94943.1 acyl-CoA dehydrogenase family protein [Syntrophales bacterium]HPI58231.1 acyl-CoA dehydrogenase family protein [Syntrophales bacterium]HPN25597.1 acyl-CoA dehydrogenase family protein [Syntrophales bacterium]HQM28145.1 acyl-CoA dehydrogenase family protein [Syntrophales bacterium]